MDDSTRNANTIRTNQRCNTSHGTTAIDESHSNNANSPTEERQGMGNWLYTHSSILLLNKQCEETDSYINMNPSGTLSLVEYGAYLPRRAFCLEWRPDVDILTPANSPDAPKFMRLWLDDVSNIEIRALGLIIRLLSKYNHLTYTEFFFQNGNAGLLISTLRLQHIIKPLAIVGVIEKFIVLSNTQNWSKTKIYINMMKHGIPEARHMHVRDGGDECDLELRRYSLIALTKFGMETNNLQDQRCIYLRKQLDVKNKQ